MKKLTIFITTLLISQLSALSQPCLPEGITFTTQEEIDNFQINYPGCIEIEGDVCICGSNITNLNGLDILTSIGGRLMIGSEYPYIWGNDVLMSLAGLDGVTSIGGDLVIGGNYSLTSLTGLTGLTYIGGDLIIGLATPWSGNPLLENLSGLEGLTIISGAINIIGNDAITNLVGLEGLLSIGDGLYIAGNANLTTLTGLEGLTSIGDNLNIGGNPSLTNLSGINNLSFIGGQLVIEDNEALISLTGLEVVEHIGWTLCIFDNSSLSSCEVESVCNYLAETPGEAWITNNAPGCNNPEEVEEACESVSIDETDLPEKLNIHPNPFSSIITITYEIAQPGITEIQIFNQIGQVIKEFSKLDSQVGVNKVIWQANDVSPGIYFCKLKANERIQMRKIIKL